jgi:hypothetical protein
MRVPRVLIVALALALVSCSSSLAQGGYPSGCFTAAAVANCVPTDGGSCSTRYLLANQIYDEGYDYSWVPKECCGTEVWTVLSFESYCYATGLRDPASMQQLTKLAREKPLLMAGCDGYLRPLPQTLALSDRAAPAPEIPLTSRKPLLTLGPGN